MTKTIEIYEWPQPCCELHDLITDSYVSIRTTEAAEAVIESLHRFLDSTKESA